MRSYAQGRFGDFSIIPTENGFRWEIPAGQMTMRYTAEISDDTWHEVGDRFTPSGDSLRFMEMTLMRVSDTDWPEAGAVDPK